MSLLTAGCDLWISDAPLSVPSAATVVNATS